MVVNSPDLNRKLTKNIIIIIIIIIVRKKSQKVSRAGELYECLVRRLVVNDISVVQMQCLLSAERKHSRRR